MCLRLTQIHSRVSCEWRAAVTRSECVRGEWHSNHLSLFLPLPLFFLPLSHFSAAVMQGRWVSLWFCATVGCYFLRLWDGGEKHTNRISVMLNSWLSEGPFHTKEPLAKPGTALQRFNQWVLLLNRKLVLHCQTTTAHSYELNIISSQCCLMTDWLKHHQFICFYHLFSARKIIFSKCICTTPSTTQRRSLLFITPIRYSPVLFPVCIPGDQKTFCVKCGAIWTCKTFNYLSWKNNSRLSSSRRGGSGL